MASTYRIHCYAKALTQEGLPLKVISTKSEIKYTGRSINYKSEFDGIPYHILFNHGKFNSKWVSYLWAELNSFFLLFYCILNFRKFEVLLLYGMGVLPRLILIPFMYCLGKKIYLEINEYPYSTEGSKFTRIKIVRKMLRWLTLKCIIPRMDGLIVISENLKTIVNRYAPSTPVLKVPILVDLNRAHSIKKSLRPHPNPYLFHAGSLSIQKDGIIKVIEAYAKAAKALKPLQLDLILTNKKTFNSVWQSIEKILMDHDLYDHLKITGYLSEKELHSYMHHASALVINKPLTFQNTYNFPTKLGDYLLSASPVVLAAEGIEANNFLYDKVNSLVVLPDDVEGIKNALIFCCTATKIANSIGKSGRKTALEHFDYKQHSLRIKNFFSIQ